MPLWGNEDRKGAAPKFANTSMSDSSRMYGNVFGVSTNEMSIDGNLKVPHAGWVSVKTYIDSSGNRRYKSEVLVASKDITGDDNDDDFYFVSNLPSQEYNFDGGNTLPDWMTFTRNSVATYLDADNVWQIANSGIPRPYYEDGIRTGIWYERASQNYNMNYNANPDASLTNINLILGAANLTDVVSRELVPDQLANSGLQNLCTSGYAFKVVAGANNVVVNITGGMSGTPVASMSIFTMTSDANVGYIHRSSITDGSQKTELPTTEGYFQRTTWDAFTCASGDRLSITVRAGKTLYWVLNQMEREVGISSNPIITAGSSTVKAKDDIIIGNINQHSWFNGNSACILHRVTPAPHVANVLYGQFNHDWIYINRDWDANNAHRVEAQYKASTLYNEGEANGTLLVTGEDRKCSNFVPGKTVTFVYQWDNASQTIRTMFRDGQPKTVTSAAGMPTGLNVMQIMPGFNGAIHKLEFFNKTISATTIAKRMYEANVQTMGLLGQSFSQNIIRNQSSEDGAGEQVWIKSMEDIDPNFRFEICASATGSTSFDRTDPSQWNTLFWYDADTGEMGVPMQRCEEHLTLALRRGSKIKWLLHTNHSSARTPSVYDGLLETYDHIYEYFRSLCESYQGFKPKIIMMPHIRRSASNIIYVPNRLFNYTLQENLDYFHLAPESFDVQLHSDGLHYATEGYMQYMPRLARFIANTEGYPVSHVYGPSVSDFERSGNTILLNILHDVDADNHGNQDPNNLIGFRYFDSTYANTYSSGAEGSSEISCTASWTSANTIEVQLASDPDDGNGEGALWFAYGSMNEVSNANTSFLPKDNSDQALPLRAGRWGV